MAGVAPLAWGCTPADLRRAYPADTMVALPALRMTRAVTVAAPPQTVWRWVCQIAVAPYSYDWIDNLGRRSPRTLTPGLGEPQVGDRMQIYRVSEVAPGHHWSGTAIPRVFGDTAVTYAVEAQGAGSRLVCRLVISQRGPVAWVWSRLLAWGDLVMMRKQLLTLRDLAEGRG